jgi:hypothetical protein
MDRNSNQWIARQGRKDGGPKKGDGEGKEVVNTTNNIDNRNLSKSREAQLPGESGLKHNGSSQNCVQGTELFHSNRQGG